MGRKQSRAGQHVLLCLTLLTVLPACSLLRDFSDSRVARESLRQSQAFFDQGDYEAALQGYRQVLALARNQPPADVAYFHIGLIYAHPQNTQRDNRKALEAFTKVVTDYTQSPWREQAIIWVAALSDAEKSQLEAEASRQATEKMKQELEKTGKELDRSRPALERARLEVEKLKAEVERAKQLIEKANQVDIEIEQKRRKRGN